MGKPSGISASISPRYLCATAFNLTSFHPLQAWTMRCDYTFFSKYPNWWDEMYQSSWGCHDICPLLRWFHITQVTQSGLSSLTHWQAWGDFERFHSNMAFLLILPKEGIAEERVYGLTVVWVHPFQARVPTLDKVAKNLTLLASGSSNWPYAFMCFHVDAHHLPPPKEGHLSVMTDGMPSNIPCGQICQLEIHLFSIWRAGWYTQKDKTGA